MTDYVDAMPLLERTLGDLSKGQLVRDDRYQMLELMSAIEARPARSHPDIAVPDHDKAHPQINDARTDTYLYAKKQREKAAPLTPERFDPNQTWTLSNVLWITQELLRREATFQAGHPLASTLWTCNLLRAESLTVAFSPTSGLESDDDAASPSRRETDGLQRIVLRAILLGTLKCGEIVWDELAKGQTYEHEDVHLSLSGLSFNNLMASCFPPSPPPPALVSVSPLALPGQNLDHHAGLEMDSQPATRMITTDEVLQALDDALSWVDRRREFADGQSQTAGDDDDGHDEAEWSALRTLLMYRINLLYVLALLTSPARTSSADVLQHLSHLRSELDRLDTQLASVASSPPSPSQALRAIFLPSPDVALLATQQPPRPVELLSIRAAVEQTREMCRDLDELVRLWEAWDRDQAGWPELSRVMQTRGRKASGVVPYVRSLQQSLISPSPTAPLFGSHPILSLVSSFLTTSLPLADAPTLIPNLLHSLSFLRLRDSANLADSPAHHLLTFLEQDVARDLLLRNSVHLAAQNRARQRRWTVKLVCADRAVTMRARIEQTVRPAWDRVLPSLIGSRQGTAGDPGTSTETPLLGVLTLQQYDDLVRLPDLLAVAIDRQNALWALESHMSGFEAWMGLFDSVEEKVQAWWVGERVARLIQEEQPVRGVMTQTPPFDELDAIRALCRSSRFLAHRSASHSPPRFSNPFLADLAVPPRDAARGRFRQHHEWLNALFGPSRISYDEFEREIAAERTQDGDSLTASMRDELASIVDADRSSSAFSAELDCLRHIAEQHLGLLSSSALKATTDSALEASSTQNAKLEGGPQEWFRP